METLYSAHAQRTPQYFERRKWCAVIPMLSHMGNNAKRNQESILVPLIRGKRHLFVVWSTF